MFLCPFLCICRNLTKTKRAKLGHSKIPLKTIGYIHLGPTSKGPRHALLCRLKERFIFVTSSMPAGALYTVHSLYFRTLFLRWKPNTFSPNHGKPFVPLESVFFAIFNVLQILVKYSWSRIVSSLFHSEVVRELLSELSDFYQTLTR